TRAMTELASASSAARATGSWRIMISCRSCMARSAGVIRAPARSNARSHVAIWLLGVIALPGATLPVRAALHQHLAHRAALDRGVRVGELVERKFRERRKHCMPAGEPGIHFARGGHAVLPPFTKFPLDKL